MENWKDVNKRMTSDIAVLFKSILIGLTIIGTVLALVTFL